MTAINRISIVIPVYRSSLTVGPLMRQLAQTMERLEVEYEVIMVNDGSPDSTWQKILELCQEYKNLLGINLLRNYGQHNALLCGIRAARYEVIITMDDDLQHPPDEIPKLLKKLDEGYDVVYGIPQAMAHSFVRNVLSRGSKFAMAQATGIKNIRDINAFRAIRTNLREAFVNYQSPNLLLDVLLSWGTTRFTSVVVNHQPRNVGKSNYNFRTLFNQFMLVITGYSTAPLRLASLVGFGTIFVGLLIFLYVIIRYFFESSLPGFPFLASIICFFGGVQLFTLGIIGEYLARMFQRSTERPTYVIGQTTEQLLRLNKGKTYHE